MDGITELVSLVIVVIAIPGILAFQKARKLERQLVLLRDELALLKTPIKVSPHPAAKAEAVAGSDADQSEAVSSKELAPAVVSETLEPPPPQGEAGADPSPELDETNVPKPADLPKKRGFIDELGARWSVWVGGLALALGAIFLLRYSIEAGFFNPALRVSLVAMLGVAALAAGEWLSRSDPADRSEALQKAYIPGVLTGVGILALFGAVYASYALYGFVGPTIAFGLLGLISMGGLALGLRQGPAMSGLGLAGSLVTPWLIATAEPSYAGLYTYLLIVSAGALILARYRGWAWLSCASAAGALGWALIGFDLHLNAQFWPWTIFVSLLTAMTIVLNASSRLPFCRLVPDRLQGTALPLVTYGIAGLLLIAMLYADLFTLRAFYVCLAAAGFGLAAAWHWQRLAGVALLSGALAWTATLSRGGDVAGGNWDWPAGGIYIPSPIEGEWGWVFFVACVIAVSLIMTAAISARKHALEPGKPALIWALAGSIFPVLLIALLWLIGARGVTHLPFALAGCGLTAAYAAVVEWYYSAQHQSDTEDGKSRVVTAQPINVFATAAGVSLLYALTAGLSGLSLTLALAAALPFIAFIGTKRPVWALRVACPAFGAVLALHVLYSLAAYPDAVGNRIIFNQLWLYFAVPAAAAGAAAWLMSQRLVDKWSQASEALALALTALFAVFQVRHYMNGGDLFAPELTLEELSLQTLVALCFSLGLSRIKDVGRFSLFSIAAMGAMAVSLLNLILGNLIGLNPFFNAAVEIMGGLLFNSLLLAYLLPGLFLGAIAWLQQDKRPDWYLKTLGGASLAMMIAYVTTMVRLGYHGGEEMSLARSAIENAEQYTYSIVWLIFGIALLAGGMVFKVRELRIGSAAVMVLTVIKVFLVDMSELEGILRALSFVGLGVVLIGMGLVYQRILTRSEEDAAEAETL